MKRIEYNDIDALKNHYKELWFKSPSFKSLQDKWISARADLIERGGDKFVYPTKLTDILVADFEVLAKIYFDFVKILDLIPESKKRNLEIVFCYSESRKAKIAEFFRNHNKQIGISVCCYCDMSYVNTYRLKNGKKRSHFDLDHVLPKSKCPITALSLFNLVPCCPVCNQRLKRNNTWFADIDEAIVSSPSCFRYGFDDYVKFRLIPTKTFKIIRYQDNPNSFRAEFHTSSPAYKKMINNLCLEERYDFHKCEALRLLDKIQDYPASHIKMIHNLLCQNKISYSEAKITEDIFGTEFMIKHNRTFSKMIQDILRLYRK